MESRLAALLLLAALAWAEGYVAVLVDGGPDVADVHIYAPTPDGWRPAHVVYQPELIETYVVATGGRVTMPHYNLTRYLLLIPREAVTAQGRPVPEAPPDLQLWSLEIDNGTAKVTVPLAVGRRPIATESATQATWHSLGQQPANTPNRGRIVKAHDQQKDPETVVAGREDVATAELETALATGSTVYVIGGTYFNSIAVAGTFSTYMPVYSPTGQTYACSLDNMFVIGYEAVNATVGVKVDGYITGGYLTLEVYNLNTCSQISSITLALPQYGISWTNVALPSVGPNLQLGLRIKVSGRAEAANIMVSAAIHYSKTVNSLAQAATSKAQSTSAIPDIGIGAGNNAVLFGPYIAYDGLIEGTVTVPPSTVRLTWYGSTCPHITVTYYINFIAQSFRLVTPRTTTPSGWYCYYDVPPTTLTIDKCAYAIAKAASEGILAVSIVYSTAAGGTISFGPSPILTITFDRWLEPFPSNYTDGRGSVYEEWTSLLLYNTFEILGPIYTASYHAVSEVRASNREVWLTLSDSSRITCGAKWVITAPVSRPVLYYGNTVVEKPWWAEIGKRVADALELLLSGVGRLIQRLDSISLGPVAHLFKTASGSVTKTRSDEAYAITWRKGWLETEPPLVAIRLDRVGASSSPTYVEWRTFATAALSPDRLRCNFLPDYDVGTFMYLPPAFASPEPLVKYRASIWTWRGQVSLDDFILPSSP